MLLFAVAGGQSRALRLLHFGAARDPLQRSDRVERARTIPENEKYPSR
jgi:hypothetical protein